MTTLPPRDRALALLYEFTASESLRRHALAVEAVMRAYARLLGQDEERWGQVGLLHDFDYERWPEPWPGWPAPEAAGAAGAAEVAGGARSAGEERGHPWAGSRILEERGWPEDVRRAILAHARYTGAPLDTPMARAILACDELAGFLVACALVQPDRSLASVRVESVKKKLKKKEFARSVSREDIALGAVEFGRDTGLDLDAHVAFVLEALAPLAGELGLAT